MSTSKGFLFLTIGLSAFVVGGCGPTDEPEGEAAVQMPQASPQGHAPDLRSQAATRSSRVLRIDCSVMITSSCGITRPASAYPGPRA